VARVPKPKSAALHVGGTSHAVLKAWNKSRWRNEPLTLKALYDAYIATWADRADEPIPWELTRSTFISGRVKQARSPWMRRWMVMLIGS
jgi:hypothetical protein